ncbi:MAG: hypothetical protein KF841_12945 [Phycisphaerae bacterium]|nr:hypothetical protein [Phycisphaerae bacterium]
MSKRGLIVLLVGLNLTLAAALILTGWQPPAAMAQAAPLGQNYSIVAGEVRNGMDGLYVLDLALRRLHVFIPNRDQNNRRLFHVGFRDLQRDFRGK